MSTTPQINISNVISISVSTPPAGLADFQVNNLAIFTQVRSATIHTVMRVHGPYDAAILLECDGLERTRLRGLEPFFQINIDHHATGKRFAQLNWIDRHAASVGEMVYRMVKAAGATVTADMASCLYTTILTDTGGFCYGATRVSTRPHSRREYRRFRPK